MLGDQDEKADTCGVVYEIPRHNCELKYTGETGRKFNTRLSKQTKIYDKYTLGQNESSETVFNKSAVIDHMAKANHVMDWEWTKVVDSENNQRFRQVKEATRISQSPHINYNLGGVCRYFFASRDQSGGRWSGSGSRSSGITGSGSQSDDGSRCELKQSQ